MTLSNRNKTLIFGIILQVPLLLLPLLSFSTVIKSVKTAQAQAILRPDSIIQRISGFIFDPAPFAPLISIIALLLFSITTMILLYYFFEKTQTAEIFFFSVFCWSLTFEVFRIPLLLSQSGEASNVMVYAASRMLTFGRIFGLFCFFTSAIYACGVDYQKHGRILLLLLAISLGVSTSIPVDIQGWDSSYVIISGFYDLLRMLERTISILASFSFLMAVKITGEKDYLLVSLGSAMAFLGRDALVHSDNWLASSIGIVLLSVGAFLMASRIHRLYLWM